MNLTQYQVYLLNQEFEEISKNVENDQRNREIQSILGSSTVIIKYSDNQVCVGTTFGVNFIEDGELQDEVIYTLVESKVASESIEDGIVSLDSPFGISIHRKKEGESFAYETRTGFLISGVISRIYSKEQHQDFIKDLKKKKKALGVKKG